MDGSKAGGAKTGKTTGADTGAESSAADTVVTAAAAAAVAAAKASAVGLPEVEVYLSTLALTTLLRHKATEDAMGVAPALLERAVSFNRR